ncbi:MAG: hypothetical protein NTZ46_11465 [Verrucomicrobia bacterium]|nr:hypothetical protein [Verrucomicrobiota bacterium]
MPLPRTESLVFNYIKSNHNIRDFWDKKAAELKAQGLTDFDAADKLAEMLIQVYTSQGAMDDLMGLVDQIDLMTIDWTRLAMMLIGRDIGAEIRAEYTQPSPALRFHISPPIKPEEQSKELHRRLIAFKAEEDAYNADVKIANTAQKWAALISFLVGFGLTGWLWFQFRWEFTSKNLLLSLGVAVIIGIFVWLVPAMFIEYLRPKKKPNPFLF